VKGRRESVVMNVIVRDVMIEGIETILVIETIDLMIAVAVGRIDLILLQRE